MSILQYRFQYHVTRDLVVLSPVDGRIGQLLTGSLEAGASTLNVGGKANTIRMRVGDVLRLISDESLLSANQKAEATALNGDDRVITGLTDQTVTVSPALVDEPNSEGEKFFEFQVLRPSPYQSVTFYRADQDPFSPAFYVNGEVVIPDVDTPGGGVVVISGEFGQITFTPLGASRWAMKMEIEIDGNIEILVPDGADYIDICLTNMNVFQDIPVFTISQDGSRLGPWLISRLRIAERTMGSAYVTGHPVDARLRRILIEADREKVPAGTTSEFLVVLKNRDDLERINLDGCLVTWEVRDAVKRAIKATGQASVVSSGLVRVEIPANAVGEGFYTLEIEVNFGGNPEFILRTNPVSFFVGV